MAEHQWPTARRTLEEALGQYSNLLAAPRLLTVWADRQRHTLALDTHLVGELRQNQKDPTALELFADRCAAARSFARRRRS